MKPDENVNSSPVQANMKIGPVFKTECLKSRSGETGEGGSADERAEDELREPSGFSSGGVLGKREGTLNDGHRGETRHNLTQAREETFVKGNACSKHSPCFPTSIEKQANKAKVLSAAELRFSFFFS